MMNIIRLYIYPLFLGFCYCTVVGVADGGCAGCLCNHAEFSGRNTVLNPAHAQAYFPSAITTMVIG